MSKVVEAQRLTKAYDTLTAVAGISFEIHEGECFGFLGPNGAGKSTTMRILYRAAHLTEVTLKILGWDATSETYDREIKQKIGVIPQDNNLDEELTVIDNLLVYCRFHKLYGTKAKRRAEEILSFVNLQEKAGTLVRFLSGGQKRRTLIARGLIGEPGLIILDEPTTGLDPQARQNLWAQMRLLKIQKKTLVLTTHYMDEAEQLCDRLVIMDRGAIVEQGRPRELILKHVGRHVVEVGFGLGKPPATPTENIRRLCRHHEVFADRLFLHTEFGEKLLQEVTIAYPDRETLLRHATLEDVFLRITGRRLTE